MSKGKERRVKSQSSHDEDDGSEDYMAKLSDFGLAKAEPQGDETHVSTRVMGTYSYAAPEYVMTGKEEDLRGFAYR
ncbi:hypothetical protein ACS0TY_003145 [Phlomoides rotata]